MPHVVLGVPANASFAEVRRAYMRLARATHPDKSGDTAAAFQRVLSAYEAMRSRAGRA